MYPVQNIDALLLIATTLASKRRPAQLVDIIAAIDLLQASIPDTEPLLDAFRHLGKHGMLRADENGISLTDNAEKIMATQPKGGRGEERIFRVRDDLSAFTTQASHAPVIVTEAALSAALIAHRVSGEGTGKNLLVPKPTTNGDQQRPGQRFRKPLPARKRKR